MHFQCCGKATAPASGSRARVSDGKGKQGGDSGDGGDGGGLTLDPLLVELLRKIPAKGEGWPAAKRVRWFRTFAMNVFQIYGDEGEPVELKIEAVQEEK